MRCSTFFVSSAMIALAQPALAQDDNLSSATIIVTASRSAQTTLETGKSITVIDEVQIERSQNAAVVDLLRNVPGVTINRNGGIGSFANVTIRGADASQTVALIDGIKINDPSSPAGGFNFGNLLTGNIARIEVLRGSHSVIWGSQAIGGVVHIMTRAPTGDINVNARAEYGNYDTGQIVGNVSGKFGPVAASIGGGYYRSDGISAFNEDSGATEADGYRNYGANGKFEIALNDNISAELRGYYSDGKTDIDGFAPPDFSFGDTAETDANKEFVGYSGLNAALFDGRFRNRIGFAYTSIKRDSFNAGFQTFDSRGENERFEYQGRLEVSHRLSAVFGAETEKSRYASSSFGGPISRASATVDSFYGQLTVKPFNGLAATAGVRHDNHSSFGGQTTIAGDVVYSPNQGMTVFRASYGEGFKVPSLFQLFSDFGNVTLEPETARSWDAGLTQILVDGRLEISTTVFHRDSINLIDFVGCSAQTGICTNRPFGTYDNIARARAKGVEMRVLMRPVDALTVAMNYGLVDSENRDNGLVLARRPKHSINASIDYSWPFGVQTGATVTHVGASFDDAANSRRTQGYVIADLRAAVPVTDNIEFYGRIENLFNEEYETIFLYGTPGRSAFAGIRVSY
jgi:vitamin B12 transporter